MEAGADAPGDDLVVLVSARVVDGDGVTVAATDIDEQRRDRAHLRRPGDRDADPARGAPRRRPGTAAVRGRVHVAAGYGPDPPRRSVRFYCVDPREFTQWRDRACDAGVRVTRSTGQVAFRGCPECCRSTCARSIVSRVSREVSIRTRSQARSDPSWAGRPTSSRDHRMPDVPRVLLVGVPCAGRHVIISILLALGASRRHDVGALLPAGALEPGPTGPPLMSDQLDVVRQALAGLPHFGICHGAIPFDPRVLELAREYQAAPVFITRDPADLVLAVAHQIRVHQQPPELAERFGSLDHDELVSMLVAGEPPAVPLDRLYAWFEGWRTAPGVLMLRVEELIGPYGGGDETTRSHAVARLADARRSPGR